MNSQSSVYGTSDIDKPSPAPDKEGRKEGGSSAQTKGPIPGAEGEEEELRGRKREKKMELVTEMLEGRKIIR
jgi:hypothetical protein